MNPAAAANLEIGVPSDEGGRASCNPAGAAEGSVATTSSYEPCRTRAHSAGRVSIFPFQALSILSDVIMMAQKKRPFASPRRHRQPSRPFRSRSLAFECLPAQPATIPADKSAHPSLTVVEYDRTAAPGQQ